MVRRAQKGDREAFLELMKQQEHSLTRAAMAILQNEEDVADAVSETVLTAFQKLCTLREPKYFKTWLTRVLIYNCYDILRRQKRLTSLEELPEQGLPGQEERDTVLDIRDSLNALAENDRLVLTLRYLDDLTVRQIAGILSVKEGTVRVRLMRGRERFAKIYLEREKSSHETHEAEECAGRQSRTRGEGA